MAPEATEAGPIALVRDGDRIVLDMTTRTLDLLVDEPSCSAAAPSGPRRRPGALLGVLGKYAKLVGSAAQGAVCSTGPAVLCGGFQRTALSVNAVGPKCAFT